MGINNKPTVGGSDGTWGLELNNVLDSLNPATTVGDLVYAATASAGNGVPTRLAVGSASSVLTVGAASSLKWTTSTGTGNNVLSANPNLTGAVSIQSAQYLIISGSSTSQPYLQLTQQSTTGSVGGATSIFLTKSPTDNIIPSGTGLGSLKFRGLGTTGNASDSAQINGIGVTQGTTFLEGAMTFSTIDSAGTNAERFRIASTSANFQAITLNVTETNVDTVAEIQATGTAATIQLHSGITALGLNPLVSASDNGLIFYGTASNTGALTISPYSSVNTGIRIAAANTIAISGSTTFSGGTASITGTASISSSVAIGGTLNATTLQQNGNAVPTIVTTARMAQGIATGTTTAAGLLNIATGLTTVTNIVVSNGASAQTHLVSSASSYSGANASVILRTASTGGVLNAGAASVNWIAFGT